MGTRHLPRRQPMTGALQPARQGGMGATPQVMLPVYNFSAFIQTGLKAHGHRRPVRFGAEFVLSRPLQTYRPTRNMHRDYRSIRASIVGAVVTVAARGLGMNTVYLGILQPDNGGSDVFVHISAVQAAGLQGLEDKQKVSYELETGRNGKEKVSELQAL